MKKNYQNSLKFAFISSIIYLFNICFVEHYDNTEYQVFFRTMFFSTNQNIELYIKFTQIKFSLFQSHGENVIYDCLNL